MNRWVVLPVGLLVLVILVFGGIADRAIVDQARSVESAAFAEADETARLAAFSVRATLARHELAVVARGPGPGVTVYRRLLFPRRSLRHGTGQPYGGRSTIELVDLVQNSTGTTAQGLPEAAVAAAALGTVDSKTRAGQRLLSGQLPVHPDDLAFLAQILGLGEDPRVESLETRLRAAPAAASLPIFPDFRRTLTERGTVEGWTRRDGEGFGYEVSVSTLLEQSRISNRTKLANDPSLSGDPARRLIAAVPDVEGLELAVSPEVPRRWPIRTMRVGLWAAVLMSLLGIVAAVRAFSREASVVAREKAFLASVTHELRTPLAAIRLLGETLTKGRGSSQEYGALIAHESERLEALVDRVLAVTRMDEAPSFSRVQPCEIITSVVQLIKPRAERRDVTIDWHDPGIEGSMLEATWDGEAVRQALLNLLDNAIKHGRRGGRIEVRAGQEGESLRLSVADDGPGVRRQDRKRIFGRFVRGETDSAGTGLGLALVQQVAQAHGGRVDLVTGEGRGSTFALLLPLVPPGAGIALEEQRVPV